MKVYDLSIKKIIRYLQLVSLDNLQALGPNPLGRVAVLRPELVF